MNNILLGVNVDHVATIRQTRGTRYPEPIQAALIAEQSGADAITLHLREDRRHIQDRDVELLNQTLQTRMNLEMAATQEMQAIAKRIKPKTCCLVPEHRAELTTEGGLDVKAQQMYLQDYCAVLTESEIQVSLFIDPDFSQLDAAIQVGVPIVEIHTGIYADASTHKSRTKALTQIQQAVAYGHKLGLQVNAGHGLDYHNVQAIASIPHITELNIGHSIIARAIFIGLDAAVRDMKSLICNSI